MAKHPMRGLILVFFLGWSVYGVARYIRSPIRSSDATRTLLFLVAYPIAVYLAYQNKPVPGLVGAPLALALIPWLNAGLHLSEALNKPDRVVPSGEFVGLPAKFWLWGAGCGAVLGLLKG